MFARAASEVRAFEVQSEDPAVSATASGGMLTIEPHVNFEGRATIIVFATMVDGNRIALRLTPQVEPTPRPTVRGWRLTLRNESP